MLLVYGLAVGGAGVLLFLAGLRAFRRPQPPRWLQVGVVGDLLVVAVIGLWTMGFGLVFKFAFDLTERGFSLTEGLLAGSVLLALLFAGWALRSLGAGQPAVAASVPGAASVVPLAANDDPRPSTPRPSGQPSGKPAGRRRRGKAA